MTDLRKAAEMALAKLDHLWEIGIDAEYKVELLPEIHALRQALAQPEQEVLVWMNKYGHVSSTQSEEYNAPLYTAPPKREWVGLDKSDMNVLRGVAMFTSDADGFIRLVEDNLRRKNT